MDIIDQPLTEAELNYLDDFLFERIDDDTDTTSKDEGIINVSELDGLLTAVVSGPTVVNPSSWMPAIWGDFEPQFRDEDELKYVFGLLIRHMNDISDRLMNDPFAYEPMFMERVLDDGSYTIVDEWCEGYVRGVALSARDWAAGGNAVAQLLAPIADFTHTTDWAAHDTDDQAEVARRQALIPNAVRELHAFWLARRQPGQRATPAPARRENPVGRNDPCPCGSGKKYKKCCLQ